MIEVPDAHRVKLYRQFLSLSQAELARLLETTQTTVARWESEPSPITPTAMAHIQARAELKLREEFQKLWAKLIPELALCDFDVLQRWPANVDKFEIDSQGNFYLGPVEIVGYREHALYIRVGDGEWYALDRQSNPLKVNGDFVNLVRLTGRLHRPVDGSVVNDPRTQRERIKKLAREVAPKANVVFDFRQMPTWISFRLEESGRTRVLGVPSGYFHANDLAAWSDARLSAYIKALISIKVTP